MHLFVGLPETVSLIKFISTYVVTTFWHKIKGNMGSLVSRFPGRVLGRPSALMSPLLDCVGEDLPSCDRYMTPSNPTFWRNDPIFTPPIEEDIAASAGFWLLEHSTDVSVASAVPQHSSTSCGYHIIPPRPRPFDSVTRTWDASECLSSAIPLPSRPCSLPPRTASSITRDSFGSPPRTPGLRYRSVPPVSLQISSFTYTAKNGAEMPY